ncbi:MAG: tRNA-dihydrouridine synthase family protein [Desulfamplus sp.]|nr:tRNA-dihydrouridine synthase family protein [Desulfamplus sp.]
MQIGKCKLEGHTVLAPLAGVTNLPFRYIVKRCGCSLVCSEMVSAKGLLYNSQKTFSLLQTTPEEKPFSVQIFGSEPKEMAKAAFIIENTYISQKNSNIDKSDLFKTSLLNKEEESNKIADIIDINFGCSVKKVVKTGAGVALMQNLSNAENVIKAVRDSISIPLTIKIRSGWDSSGTQAFKLAELAQRNGVDAITLHPRTASQGFKGKADWSLIKQLKANMSIPLIGNGDIACAEDGLRMIEETKCDAVMVGRAAMSNPFILSDIELLLSKKKDSRKAKYEQDSVYKPIYYTNYHSSYESSESSFRSSEARYKNRSIDEIFALMIELLKSCVDYFGELQACKMMRSRLVWFVKGYPECSKFRRDLTNIESMAQALEIIEKYQHFLRSKKVFDNFESMAGQGRG